MKAQLLFERKLKVVRKEPLGYRTPTEVHAYPDRDAMTFLKQWRHKAMAKATAT